MAWGLNQLAHRHGDLVDELRSEAAQVRRAHEGAVAGERTDLAAADDRLRRTIRDLAGRAARMVVEHDVGASGHRDDIEAALWAAAVDFEMADQLAAGTLQATPEPPAGGFGLAAVGEAVDDAGDGPSERERRTAEATLRRQEVGVERAADTVGRRRQRVRQLEDRLADERRRLEEEEAVLAEREAERDDARAVLDRLEGGSA